VSVSGTVLCIVALLLGFYQAPFAHIHTDDSDHPASPPLHLHLHHQVPTVPAPLISSPTADTDAIDVGWNLLKGSFIEIPFDLAIAGVAHLPTIAFSFAPVPTPRGRGHDPPEPAPKSPRAPPV
jgi:hypothetical protein